MPTLVTRFDITGTSSEVPAARRAIVEQTRAWGVPLDDDTACTVGVVASELVTNAVVHTSGAVTISLYHQPGRLLIEVLDTSSDAPLALEADVEEEHGRGMGLVDVLATRTGWQHVERGKRVWAEIAVPKPPPLLRAAVLRRYFAGQSGFARDGRGQPWPGRQGSCPTETRSRVSGSRAQSSQSNLGMSSSPRSEPRGQVPSAQWSCR